MTAQGDFFYPAYPKFLFHSTIWKKKHENKDFLKDMNIYFRIFIDICCLPSFYAFKMNRYGPNKAVINTYGILDNFFNTHHLVMSLQMTETKKLHPSQQKNLKKEKHTTQKIYNVSSILGINL